MEHNSDTLVETVDIQSFLFFRSDSKRAAAVII